MMLCSCSDFFRLQLPSLREQSLSLRALRTQTHHILNPHHITATTMTTPHTMPVCQHTDTTSSSTVINIFKLGYYDNSISSFPFLCLDGKKGWKLPTWANVVVCGRVVLNHGNGITGLNYHGLCEMSFVEDGCHGLETTHLNHCCCVWQGSTESWQRNHWLIMACGWWVS